MEALILALFSQGAGYSSGAGIEGESQFIIFFHFWFILFFGFHFGVDSEVTAIKGSTKNTVVEGG